MRRVSCGMWAATQACGTAAAGPRTASVVSGRSSSASAASHSGCASPACSGAERQRRVSFRVATQDDFPRLARRAAATSGAVEPRARRQSLPHAAARFERASTRRAPATSRFAAAAS